MYGCIFMEHIYICMYNNNRYDHVLYRALYSLQNTYIDFLLSFLLK